MELLSINTSHPIQIEHNGKLITTGIFKKPVDGPIFVSKENLTGDRQADLKNHGGEHKAVYAFSSDHYSYWSDVLQNTDLKPGAFGENLTISGLDESILHIGDQLAIGQCVLEVTQPRVPCSKLGIAVNNTNMPRLFIEHFATGIYFRVIQEGSIEKGCNIKVIKEGAFKVSIQSLFRAYYDKNYSESKSVMETAALIPELSSEWAKKLSLRLSSAK